MDPRTTEKLAFGFLRACIWIVVAFVAILILYIVIQGYSIMSWEFLTEMPRNRMTEGGIYPALMGTAYLVGISMAVAIPLGVLSAIYLNEYAKESRSTWIIEMAINNLAGTPSVVFGLFGLALFVKYLAFKPSIISASLTLSLLILPVVIRASKEALITVPQEHREASLALGVTKWKTISSIVLPEALPGIVTGIILSIGRVAGETAPIMFTGAAFFLPRLPESVFSQFMALPYHLFILATSGLNPMETRPIQYGTALVLLILVLLINSIAIIIRKHYRKKLHR